MKLIVHHNPPMHVPAIVMEKSPNGAIFVVGCKHVQDTEHHAIQPYSIPTSPDLPGHKKDTATIHAITINGVTHQLMWRCHPQVQVHANSTVLSIED
jgi:hypothetical protein